LKKSYAVRNVEKILREYNACCHSLAYLMSIRDTGLSLKKEEIARRRIKYLSHTLNALEHAVGLLDPLEQKIIRGLYFDADGSVEKVCDTCALEKSSVYRYRTRAIEKLAAAMYGG
jgi:DNA-directed RNA polymerase specialized sigma subunit